MDSVCGKDSSGSENEELRSSGEMMQMRAQIGAATVLNCAALALSQECGGVLSYSSSDEDEVAPGPGRGAPGRKRRKADIYGDPDGSIIARDIIDLRADPDNELLLKKFRLAYRVPWSVFEVRACSNICTVLFLYRTVLFLYRTASQRHHRVPLGTGNGREGHAVPSQQETSDIWA